MVRHTYTGRYRVLYVRYPVPTEFRAIGSDPLDVTVDKSHIPSRTVHLHFSRSIEIILFFFFSIY